MGKMDEKEKFEANKRSNAPFLRALDFLMKEKNFNQAQAAELLNTKSGTFSDYKNGKKRASQEMYDRLARAFCGRLNMHYLTGESEYMLLENVPDEEIVEYSMREGNPDYDALKKAKDAHMASETPTSLDRSFMIEKEVENTKSYIDKLITSLEEQIKEKDALISDKQKIIEMLEKRVSELESKLLTDGQDVLHKHPFPVGVAERDERKSTHV